MTTEKQQIELRHLIERLNESYFASSPLIHLAADGHTAVAAQFNGLRLRSHLLPLIICDNQKVLGFEAQLQAFRAFEAVSDSAMSAAIADSDDWLMFDRLHRILHVLNFIAQQASGLLFVRAGPASIAANNKANGSLFEAMLRVCGLPTSRVVVQLSAADLDEALLLRASQNYRRRGYLIGIVDVPAEQLSGWVSPPVWTDFISLPQEALNQAERSPAIRRSLSLLIKIVHSLNGGEFIASGVRSVAQAAVAQELGVYAVQSDYPLTSGRRTTDAAYRSAYERALFPADARSSHRNHYKLNS